jgi:hypothetical protein
MVVLCNVTLLLRMFSPPPWANRLSPWAKVPFPAVEAVQSEMVVLVIDKRAPLGLCTAPP